MYLNQRLVNRRIYVIYIALFAFISVLAGRLLYLQIYQHEFLTAKAELQQRRPIDLAEKRGLITDRNGNNLAIDNQSISLYAYPREYKLNKVSIEEMAEKISPLLGEDQVTLKKKLMSRSFTWLKRQMPVSDDFRNKIKSLHIPGINYVLESKRLYPKKQLAASLIGFTNIDNQGQTGIELSFENVLADKNKQEKIFLDGRGSEILSLDKDLPTMTSKVKTSKVILTLDENIQYVVERELKKGMAEYKAQRGLAMVMDLKNGDLLALATFPTYDPNDSSKRDWSVIKNWGVTDFYEPGSTMKIFSIAAALEQGVLGINEMVACPGQIKVDKWVVHDHGASPNQVRYLSPGDIIKVSSNVGTSIVTRRMTPETHRNMLLKFGFGKPTDSQLSGEVGGIVPDLPWVASRQSTISFGQGVAVTPLQIVTAISAVARGGIRIEPRIIKKIVNSEDKVIKEYKSKEIRTLSKDTADKVLKLMSTVVEEKGGTGRATKIPGYTIAGKTGTADKVEKGHYSGNVMASFLGIFPADDPQVLAFVLFDSPQTAHFASMTAVPVFKEIAQNVLNYLNIPPSKPEELIGEK
jgi:cell division protein FtsI/penicillin-binding protein 2